MVEIRGTYHKPGRTLTLSREAAAAVVARGEGVYADSRQPSATAALVSYETKVIQPANTAVIRRKEANDKAERIFREVLALRGTKGGFSKARAIAASYDVKATSWAELLTELAAALNVTSYDHSSL